MKLVEYVPVLSAIRTAQQLTAQDMPPAVWAIGVARAAKQIEAEVKLVSEQLTTEFDMEKINAFDAKRMAKLSEVAIKNPDGTPQVANGQLSFTDATAVEAVEAALTEELPEDVTLFKAFQKRQDELLQVESKKLAKLETINANLWPALPPQLIEQLLPLVK